MRVKHYHFIGIGGIGMSAIARILLKKNSKVTGSDQALSSVIEQLRQHGAAVHIGHSGDEISAEATIVYSSAISQDNAEFQKAKQLNCTLLHRSQILAQLTAGYHTLAVTGSHGKTTTSALLASVLKQAGCDPSYALGGVLLDSQLNGDGGKGQYFVLEADESDGSFLNYEASGAIITNVDHDHLEHYGTIEALKTAIGGFAAKVADPSRLFWCGDDKALCSLHMKGCSYGFGESCQLRGCNYRQEGWKTFFDVEFDGRKYWQVEVPLIGFHNALNALAVFGMCLRLGISESEVRDALKTFAGVARRCELKGEVNEVLILDDYAHHPTAIATTLSSLRKAAGERRLVAVFQPHRYSRTQSCLNEYGSVFDQADLLMITDIYAGPGEKAIKEISSRDVLKKIEEQSSVPSRYVPKELLEKELLQELRPHDVVVMMSAGDLPKLSESLVEKISKSPPKLVVGVVCGGKSAEHDISLESAGFIINSLNPALYDVKLFVISKNGRWFYGQGAMEAFKSVSDGKKENPNAPLLEQEALAELQSCDIFIPVLHGPFGEDGMIQGFFETMGKPYVGCDFRSSALCMDKVLTKRIAQSHGINTARFIHFSLHLWKTTPELILNQIMQELQFPVFVKSVHLGSSIGVKKVDDPEKLASAIDFAFQYDIHVLVENGLVGREIEFAVMGNDEVDVPPPGEILTGGDVYDYDAKYGLDSMKAIPRTDLPEELIKAGQKIAAQAYQATGCTGLARVDFFLDALGQFWLSEINPFPGFTKISMYPKIWEERGWTAHQLINRLLVLGLHRKRIQDRYIRP